MPRCISSHRPRGSQSASAAALPVAAARSRALDRAAPTAPTSQTRRRSGCDELRTAVARDRGAPVATHRARRSGPGPTDGCRIRPAAWFARHGQAAGIGSARRSSGQAQTRPDPDSVVAAAAVTHRLVKLTLGHPRRRRRRRVSQSRSPSERMSISTLVALGVDAVVDEIRDRRRRVVAHVAQRAHQSSSRGDDRDVIVHARSPPSSSSCGGGAATRAGRAVARNGTHARIAGCRPGRPARRGPAARS